MPRSLADAAMDAYAARQEADEAERQAIAGQVRTEIRSALDPLFPDVSWGTITVDSPTLATASTDGIKVKFERFVRQNYTTPEWVVAVEVVADETDAAGTYWKVVADLADLGRLISDGLITPTSHGQGSKRRRAKKS